MGCVCCSLGSFVSTILDALERISLWTVCAMLTCCLMFTIITLLSIGVGIGYHYCDVQTQVGAMAQAANAAGALRSGGDSASSGGSARRSMEKSLQPGFVHRISRREMDTVAPLDNNSSLTLPVHQNLSQTYNTKQNNSLFMYLKGKYF